MPHDFEQSTKAKPDFSLRRFLVARLRAFMIALGMIGVAATVASMGARWDWRLDLIVNMRTQLLLGASIVVLILAFMKQWKLVALFGVFLCINLFDVLPLYLPQRNASSSSAVSVKVLSGNVLTSNQSKQAYVDHLRNEDADVVFCLEVDQDWLDALLKLKDKYPHHIAEPRGDNFGIVLLSQHPFLDSRVEFFDGDLPSIVATVDVSSGNSILVIGTHPVPPKGQSYFEHRNAQLRSIADLASQSSVPTIVCGDFNATPWSPTFKSMVRVGKLKDARRGFGLKSTWPEARWPLNIPIDHVLVSPAIGVANFSTGPHLGSDHRMVIADLQVPVNSD